MAIFGSERLDGDFNLIGDVQNSNAQITLSACFYEIIEEGKAISIYGLCSAFSGEDIKIKKDGSWEDFEPKDKFIRFDILKEDYTKTYGKGKSSKKEASEISKYLYPIITEKFKEKEVFALFIDFTVSKQIIEALITGKSNKGKELSEDALENFRDSVFMFNDLQDENKDRLANAKQGEKNSSNKGGYTRYIGYSPLEKFEQIGKLLEIEYTEEGTPKPIVLASYLKELEESDKELINHVKWILAAICQ